MHKLTLSILVLAVVATVAVAPAQAQGNKFKIYAAGVYVMPLGSDDIEIEDIVETIEASSEVGWDLGFEWRIGKWAGLELDYMQAEHDIEIDGEAVATTTFAPLSASLNFHVVHTRFIDFYLGPTVSYVDWDDIEDIETGESMGTDSEFGYGGQLGLDISLVKRVAIVTALRYTSLDVTPDEEEGLSIDPLYVKVGLAIRW